MKSGRFACHVFTLALNILALTQPFYMLQLYDRVLTSGSERSLLLLTVVAVFSLCIWATLDALRAILLGRGAAYAARRLARKVTDAVAERSRDPSIALAPAMRDIETMRSKETSPAATAWMDAPYGVIFFIILFWLHWSFFVVAVIGGIALAAQAYFSDRTTEGPLGKAFTGHATGGRFADNALAARDAVHSMGMTPAIVARFLKQDAAAREFQQIASDREAQFGAIGRLTRMLTQLALLGLGAFLVLSQETTAGAMVTSGILGARALLPIESAVSGWKIMIAARQASARLDTLLSAAAEQPRRSQIPGLKGDIELENVSVVPPGGKAATLKGVNLQIAAGEYIGIIGPSGSGKSTLAKVIAGAWWQQAGIVRIGGVDSRALAIEDRAKLLGFLPQEAQLTAGTVRDNIARLTDASMDAVTAAAHKAQAHELIVNLPGAYDTDTGFGGSNLSGGQRQRIALARALFGAPRIVILDEPGNGLDAAGETALDETLRELKVGGVTIIVVSHRPAQIMAADRVVVMRDGAVAEIISHRQMVERYVARQPRTGEAKQ